MMKKALLVVALLLYVSAASWAATVADDFNRPDVSLTVNTALIGADWINGAGAEDQWGIASGQLVNSATAPGVLVNTAATMSSGNGEAFTFSVDLTPVQASRWMGVVFNYQDVDNYYYLRFKTGANSCYVYKKVAGGALTSLTGGTFVASENFALDTAYTITVSSTNSCEFDVGISGGTLTASGTAVDGVQSLASGYAGLMIEANGVGAKYDNFLLQTLGEAAPLADRHDAALWHMDGVVSTQDVYGHTRSAVDDDDGLNPVRNHVLILGNRADPFNAETVPSIVPGGVSGKALSFDGGDMAYAETAWEELDSFVLDFYFYPTTFGADAELMAVTEAFSIRQGATGIVTAYIYDQQTGLPVAVNNNASPALLNQWNHAVIRVDHGKIDISVNDVAGTSAIFSGDAKASYSPEIYLGATWAGSRKFTGLMDEVRIRHLAHSEIEVGEITQPHPRILINSAGVAEIQDLIDNHVEPNYTAWLNLKFRADAWSAYAVAAPYTGDDSLEFYSAAYTAGHYASKMALAYLLEGDPDHAAKAKEILLTWAQATPQPATNFADIYRFPNSGMDTARGMIQFIYTYDFIHNSFTAAEKQVVENWFRAVLPSIQAGIDRWDAYYVYSPADPRGYVESTNPGDQYFGQQLYQNHLMAHAMGYLCIGYAIGDPSLVQFALDSSENPRDFLELFQGIIMMDGDPEYFVGDPQDPPSQDGEMYDRYRHETLQGFGYSFLSLGEMMAMAETLYVNGIDLYSRVGTYGETLEYPFNFYADFLRTTNSTLKGGFYTDEDIAGYAYETALFEVANKHYPGNPEIEALLNAVDRGNIDGGGAPSTHFVYPTLTHATALTGGVVDLSGGIDGSGYRLEWPTAIGRTYELKRTSDLEEPTWAAVYTNVSTGGMNTFTDPQQPALTNAFYRLTIE